MATKPVDIHVRYYDSTGSRQSLSYDIEEYNEGLFDLNSVLADALKDGAGEIRISIDTEPA